LILRRNDPEKQNDEFWGQVNIIEAKGASNFILWLEKKFETDEEVVKAALSKLTKEEKRVLGL
jgi:hypothetical protein